MFTSERIVSPDVHRDAGGRRPTEATSGRRFEKIENFGVESGLGRFSVYKATSRTRTDDLLFTKQLLYQLSYGGVLCGG